MKDQNIELLANVIMVSIGVVIIMAGLWVPFIVISFCPVGWLNQWYGFPLSMTSLLWLFGAAYLGVTFMTKGTK